MSLIVIVVLVVLFVAFVLNKVKAGKQRVLEQVLRQQAGMMAGGNAAQQPQVFRQHGVTVTVNPPTIRNAGQMSGMAQTILDSMGGAEGILNMPEVRQALRDAAQHPGTTTTVTSANGGNDPFAAQPGASPFDTTSSPFAQAGGPFAAAPPIPPAMPPQGSPGGHMGVAQVLSAPSLTFDGTREVALELDAIGAPKRRVTAKLMPGQEEDIVVGSRRYVHLDPQDDSRVTLLNVGQGENVLAAGANRLDPLVLGPQLFRNGAKGSAVVKTATQTSAAVGGGTWQLELEVTPERGWPYRAELLTTVSSQEKAQKVCVVGAQVPVLYDPDDPKTMCVDSVAMGFGNPFEGRQK